MAPILEHQAKHLLRWAGLATPLSLVARRGDDITWLPEPPAVVKSLVPVGKKGAHGAVRFCHTAEDLTAAVAELSSIEVRGFPSRGVLIEHVVDIRAELFVSFTFHGAAGGPVVVLSADGGVDIEEVARSTPHRVATLTVDAVLGLNAQVLEATWLALGVEKSSVPAATDATLKMWNAFSHFDCTVLEVNPLAIDSDGSAIAVGAMADIDDEALYRQPEIRPFTTYGSGRFGRPPTDLEQQILDLIESGRHGTVRFMELPHGDFINLVQGGGCSMLSTDQMMDSGQRPATYFDATAPSDQLMRTLFHALLRRKGMRGLIFGFNIASLASVDRRFEILVEVIEDLDVDVGRFPIVVRLAGTGQDRAREVAKRVPGLEFYADEVTIEEAVDRFIDLLAAKAPSQ